MLLLKENNSLLQKTLRGKSKKEKNKNKNVCKNHTEVWCTKKIQKFNFAAGIIEHIS